MRKYVHAINHSRKSWLNLIRLLSKHDLFLNQGCRRQERSCDAPGEGRRGSPALAIIARAGTPAWRRPARADLTLLKLLLNPVSAFFTSDLVL